MASPARYYHAVTVVPENCDACMKCLRTCPTTALRIRDETPVIREDLCIDCGACIVACPRQAILPDVDTYEETIGRKSSIKVRVAVPSPVVYAQFGLDATLPDLHAALKSLGFDYVYDVFEACQIGALALQEHLSRDTSAPRKPFISSMCPAVVRLIQVRYPTLVKRVLPLEPPRELSAREAKIKIAKKHGLDIAEVGTFYISTCPAKSVSVLQPAEKMSSFLDGSIAISDIYIPLRKALESLRASESAARNSEKFVFGSGWERTGFMSRTLNVKNWIAVSGMQHVSGILDDIEGGKLDGVAFVEANACVEGCVGGSLCVENIYVARSKLLILERDHDPVRKPDPGWVRQLYDNGYFFIENEVKPRPRQGSAPSISEGILLMKRRDELVARLPGIDCCACGAPSCEAFAEDVLRKRTELDTCPYLDSGVKDS